MAIPMNLQQNTNQKTKKIDDLFQQAVSGSLAGAKTPAPISTASQAVAPAQMPQTGGYKWGGNTYGSVEEQQKAMKAQGQYAPNPGAVTSAAVSAAPGVAPTAPPATDNSQNLRTKFQSALAPQVTEAINAATSQVDPFMTGQRAAEITRQAIKPAQEQLAQFEIEQSKTATADAKQKVKDEVAALLPLVQAGNATAKARYQQLMSQEYGGTTPTTSTTPSLGPTISTIDWTGGVSGTSDTNKKALEGQMAALDQSVAAGDAASITKYNELANEYYGTQQKVYKTAPVGATGKGINRKYADQINVVEGKMPPAKLKSLSDSLGNLHGYGGVGDKLNQIWNDFDILLNQASTDSFQSEADAQKFIAIGDFLNSLPNSINFNDANTLHTIAKKVQPLSVYGY